MTMGMGCLKQGVTYLARSGLSEMAQVICDFGL